MTIEQRVEAANAEVMKILTEGRPRWIDVRPAIEYTKEEEKHYAESLSEMIKKSRTKFLFRQHCITTNIPNIQKRAAFPGINP